MEFDSPIRIHWQPGDHVDGRIIDAVHRSRPLALVLEVDRISQASALDLPWDGGSAVIIYRGWRDPDRDLPSGIARRWEFPIRGPDEAGALADTALLGVPPEEASFRWFPRRGRLKDLVPIMKAAADAGCGLTLPNRPAGVITSEGRHAFPDARELSGRVLAEIRGFSKMLQSDRVRVHDYILTESLGVQRVEPPGCEAANSIACIDSGGGVYPCETLMVPMGDLSHEGLDIIWASPLRHRIRKDVSMVPGICSPCRELPRCRGGCRGAVYHLMGHYGAPDPLCPVVSDKEKR